MQTSRAMNGSYSTTSHASVPGPSLTKFIVLRPLKRKTLQLKSRQFSLTSSLSSSPPHILQSDNGMEFKNINLAKKMRELWPGCKTALNGRPRSSPESGLRREG